MHGNRFPEGKSFSYITELKRVYYRFSFSIYSTHSSISNTHQSYESSFSRINQIGRSREHGFEAFHIAGNSSIQYVLRQSPIRRLHPYRFQPVALYGNLCVWSFLFCDLRMNILWRLQVSGLQSWSLTYYCSSYSVFISRRAFDNLLVILLSNPSIYTREIWELELVFGIHVVCIIDYVASFYTKLVGICGLYLGFIYDLATFIIYFYRLQDDNLSLDGFKVCLLEAIFLSITLEIVQV